MTRSEITDLYFAEARSKLIDLAAFLDRAERSEGADDFRLKSLRTAIKELSSSSPEKAKKVLMVLSDPTTDPIPAAGEKSASGAWSGFQPRS